MDRQQAVAGVVAEGVDAGTLVAVLNEVDEALLLLDGRQRLLLATRRMWDLFELPEEVDLGVIRSAIASCLADPEAYLRVVEEADEEQDLELELVRPSRRVVRRRVRPGPQGAGVLISYRDVTRDAELNRMKSEFVSSVSHELRTPMAAVKGFISVILDDEQSMDAEQRREFLHIAREETERLSRLIDDILDVARIESGRRATKQRCFGVNELLRDAALAVWADAAAGDIDFKIEAPPAEWMMVADRDQIEQAVVNLLSNAVKFTPQGGRVRAGAELAGDELLLWVSDTGCGIEPEELPHLFEKFYRSRAAKATRRGTGLGLAITEEIVTAHEGRIEVVSTPGEGSRFTLHLPRLTSLGGT